MQSLGFESRKRCYNTGAVHIFPAMFLHYLSLFLNSCHLVHTAFVVVFCHTVSTALFVVLGEDWKYCTLYGSIHWDNRSTGNNLCQLSWLEERYVTFGNWCEFRNLCFHLGLIHTWKIRSFVTWYYNRVITNIQCLNSYRSQSELYPSVES